jgi:hypothetical protein
MRWRVRENLSNVNWRRLGRRVGNFGIAASVSAAAWYVSDSPRFSPLAAPLANAGASMLLRQVREVRDSVTKNVSPAVEYGVDAVYGALLLGACLGACVAQKQNPQMLAPANALCYLAIGKLVSEVGFDISDTPGKVWGIALNSLWKRWEEKAPSEAPPSDESLPRPAGMARSREGLSVENVAPSERFSQPQNPDFQAIIEWMGEHQKQLNTCYERIGDTASHYEAMKKLQEELENLKRQQPQEALERIQNALRHQQLQIDVQGRSIAGSFMVRSDTSSVASTEEGSQTSALPQVVISDPEGHHFAPSQQLRSSRRPSFSPRRTETDPQNIPRQGRTSRRGERASSAAPAGAGVQQGGSSTLAQGPPVAPESSGVQNVPPQGETSRLRPLERRLERARSLPSLQRTLTPPTLAQRQRSPLLGHR